MQPAGGLRHFAIAAKLTHCLNPGIDPWNSQIFSTGLIGKLRGQCSLGKDAGKKRHKLKALSANALFRFRNTGIMHAMTSASQLLSQGKSHIHVRLPVQRRYHNIGHGPAPLLLVSQCHDRFDFGCAPGRNIAGQEHDSQ